MSGHDQAPEFYGLRCELSFFWGTPGVGPQMTSVEEIYLTDYRDIHRSVEDAIGSIAARYAFDCDRLDRPLHPHLASLTVTPIGHREYLDVTPYADLLASAVEAKRAALQARSDRAVAS